MPSNPSRTVRDVTLISMCVFLSCVVFVYENSIRECMSNKTDRCGEKRRVKREKMRQLASQSNLIVYIVYIE